MVYGVFPCLSCNMHKSAYVVCCTLCVLTHSISRFYFSFFITVSITFLETFFYCLLLNTTNFRLGCHFSFN